MKAKFLTLSILLAGSCVLANAQEKKNYYTKKASDTSLWVLVLEACLF